MSGTLILPAQRRERAPRATAHAAPVKPQVECEFCMLLMARATCQRGMRNVLVLFDLTSSQESTVKTYHVVQQQLYDGVAYSYMEIASVDSSQWERPLETAMRLQAHLESAR